MYNFFMENRVRKQVKQLLLNENYFMKELVEMLVKQKGRKTTASKNIL